MQLSFVLIQPEKQGKSTPRFLKMELLTKVSACKYFSNKASPGLCVLRTVFHPVPCRRKGEIMFPIVSAATQRFPRRCQAAQAVSTIPSLQQLPL